MHHEGSPVLIAGFSEEEIRRNMEMRVGGA